MLLLWRSPYERCICRPWHTFSFPTRSPVYPIYGVCFPTKEELDAHLSELEEAKERDHRKLGKDLGILYILIGNRLIAQIYVVVKTFFDYGSNPKFGLWIQVLYCLREQMCTAVIQNIEVFFLFKILHKEILPIFVADLMSILRKNSKTSNSLSSVVLIGRVTRIIKFYKEYTVCVFLRRKSWIFVYHHMMRTIHRTKNIRLIIELHLRKHIFFIMIPMTYKSKVQ